MPASSWSRHGPRDAAAVVASLVGFGALLRGLGLEPGATGVETAARALTAVDPCDREDAYWALRCALVGDRDQLDRFDRAFSVFWDGAPLATDAETPPHQEPDDGGGSEPASDLTRAAIAGVSGDQPTEPGDGDDEDARAAAGARWSRDERLRELDFREYGPNETVRAARLIRELARLVPHRVSRRLRAARVGAAVDRRATLRRAMRTEGHPIELARRRPRIVPRRLVFMIDVSGSMEAYARPLLIFAQAVSRASRTVEIFTFGTRLTRLTRQLAGADPDFALARAGVTIPDWAGGTRIGDNIRHLNDVWGRRGIVRGAAVVVFSDGWERGGVELLDEEMARLHRASHSLVWVNPLAGDPGYEPLAAGMATALPHLDAFLPGHNLRSLGTLASVLGELPERRRAPARTAGHSRRGGGKPALDEAFPAIPFDGPRVAEPPYNVRPSRG
ncbi:MAG: VWA domain-containing protein [Solirubrobacterales bacterium]|nr:VWA domain-containing protein [Solirubrobacterales bacterium]